ncbi:hypothetical protein AMQ84_01330 [Paenibacillus riograndensis]|uniref:Uncharacterized protein n=1 Tax=Paenibacillus riograndensis TaxID=483937 RepID=A0A132UBI0_9BACL|nr:hypothetical protein [Paenibacillus riograndensis]KWX81029.1 hypothetical protein AMQ84_01330 [Paenibacillus riograndensis]
MVVEFTVNARESAQFKGLVFKSASGNWERYVTLGRQKKLIDNYDYIAGPFLENPNYIGNIGKGKALIPKGNQIAIRSVKMAVWLFKGFAGFE